MDNEPNEFIPTRRSLLSRLRNWDDQESWKDFFDTYWKLIYNTAVKAGLTDAEAQDVVQETVFTVAKKMPKFKYHPAVGSFKGWLLKTTRWRILNHINRARMKEEPLPRRRPGVEPDDTSTAERVPDSVCTDLEKTWNAEWQQNLIDAATLRIKRRVRPKHYQMFELHVLKELPVSKVAEVLGVSTAQVHLAKFLGFPGSSKREFSVWRITCSKAVIPPPHNAASRPADERQPPSALPVRRQASGERIVIKEYIVAPKEKSYALWRKMWQALSKRLTTQARLPHQDTVPDAAKHVRQEL